MGDLPAVTGPQLIALLSNDGWTQHGQRTHGVAMVKSGSNPTIIPTKNKPLPDGTLGAILGPRQTGLGKAGLRALIDKHGLK